MFAAARRCPQCAERIRAEARMCRFCGSSLVFPSLIAGTRPAAAAPPAPTAPPPADQPVPDPTAPAPMRAPLPPAAHPRPVVAASRDPTPVILGAAALMLLVVLVWALLPPTRPVEQTTAAAPPPAALPVAAPPADPVLPPLATGETISWTAETQIDPVERQVGPLAVRIDRVGAGEDIAPAVEVRYAGASVRMEGERGGPNREHRITAIENRAGAAPVVMLQTAAFDSHCCLHVRLAGLSGGQLRIVDLGSWEGGAIPPPVDLSGDGTVDFVFEDQSFLDAFAPYGEAETVPKILNVVGGRVVDVSARPAFRRLFVAAAERTGATCRTGGDGATRNGACAAYVAAAARAGQLGTAWAAMLGAYDATAQWSLPTGCLVAPTGGACPEGQAITYQSYPDALLAFLKRRGYVARSWLPPEATLPAPDVDPAADEGGEPPV